MRLNRLTAVRVQQLRKPGFYPDGGGLYLQVTQGASGALNKSWLFRFSVPDSSKPRKRHDRWAGLGPNRHREPCGGPCGGAGGAPVASERD